MVLPATAVSSQVQESQRARPGPEYTLRTIQEVKQELATLAFLPRIVKQIKRPKRKPRRAS